MVCLSEVKGQCANAVATDATFNVENAIADLVADPSRASLELPCLLNAEQRKHVKKVVEQYPDLKCESFGFGKDRQMHLFKCKTGEDSKEDQASERSPQRVSVKNTFIDDWIDAEVTSADARIVQSMPHNMFGQCLSAEISQQTPPVWEDEESTQILAASKEVASIHVASAIESLEEDQFIALGTEVVIEGLVKAPGFNGAHGVVQSWDVESGRYNVLLSGQAQGQRWAKIKGENLRQASPRKAYWSDII
jgi:hypothetical protein